MDDLLHDIIAEAKDQLATADGHLASLESGPHDPDALARALRIFHAVKGTCGFVGLDLLRALAHQAETTLLDATGNPEGLAATRMLTDQCRAALAAAEHSTGAVESGRAIPSRSGDRERIEAAVRLLPALGEKLAAALDKQVAFDVRADAVTLDQRTVRLLRSALVHLVHNAVDHGLESPAERRAQGKPEIGTIRVRVREMERDIVVAVADDGRGFSNEKFAATALACGVATKGEIAAMTEAEVQRLAFARGLSTAAALTQVSGRGIGMDAVQGALQELGGDVEVVSAPGEGTCVTLTFPRSAVPGRELIRPEARTA